MGEILAVLRAAVDAYLVFVRTLHTWKMTVNSMTSLTGPTMVWSGTIDITMAFFSRSQIFSNL